MLDWFAGNGAYMNLIHCMGEDWLWIGITVALDVAVAAGYLLIAKHWWVNERTLPDIPARRALASMRNIFLFCGLCGYLFIPVKMVWPAWRLYDMVMLVLVYFTWRYAWGAKDLKVIYGELGKTNKLAKELEATKEESKKKSFFLNAISHDLRTPLNGLMLQASIADMSVESGDNETLRQAVQDMRRSARVTSDLLDSLLEVARLDWAADSNNCTSFGLQDLIRDACEQHRTAAEQKGLLLKTVCPAELRVTTDRVKLGRMLSNLVGNAVKFTAKGQVRVEVVYSHESAEVHVCDTGIGISEADQEQLFQEFFQVNNNERDRRKGFGLGLAITRRLARQLGGDVTVTSAPGEGSRFTVALPGVIRAQPAVPAATDPDAGAVNVAAG